MNSLLLFLCVFSAAVTLSRCNEVLEDPEATPTVTECPNCNEWVGIGTGLGVSFLVVFMLLGLTIVTVLVVKRRKRRVGYEEFK